MDDNDLLDEIHKAVCPDLYEQYTSGMSYKLSDLTHSEITLEALTEEAQYIIDTPYDELLEAMEQIS